MDKEVVLTAIAADDFDQVVNYLNYTWGLAVTHNFIERFESVLTLLSRSPGIFPFFDERKQIQKCIVTKHNILFFTETDLTIKILTVFDTRQDPHKLTKII